VRTIAVDEYDCAYNKRFLVIFPPDANAEVKKTRESDLELSRSMRRKMVRETFFKLAVRFEQLEKYEILYRYKRIEASEIRLLQIEPSRDFASDIFVSLVTIADEAIGAHIKEYEALSYVWGQGPADRPI
jgi:hypothetical protein